MRRTSASSRQTTVNVEQSVLLGGRNIEFIKELLERAGHYVPFLFTDVEVYVSIWRGASGSNMINDVGLRPIIFFVNCWIAHTTSLSAQNPMQ
jgi:hypothetical protein